MARGGIINTGVIGGGRPVWQCGTVRRIDVATGLTTAGARIGVGRPGGFAALVGPFVGVEASPDGDNWIPVGSGAVFPLVSTSRGRGGRLALRQASGGGAGLLVAVPFDSETEARAWSAIMSGSGVPQAGLIFTPGDTQANPTNLAGVESFAMMWNSVDGQWNRLRARTPNDAIPLENLLETLSCGALFDVTNNVYKRSQTLPNTTTGRAKTEDSFLGVTAATALKALNALSTTTVYTVPAGKVFDLGWFGIYSGAATTAGSYAQLLAAGKTISITPVGALAANTNVLNGGGAGVSLNAGETLQLDIGTGGGTGSVGLTISGKERYAE